MPYEATDWAGGNDCSGPGWSRLPGSPQPTWMIPIATSNCASPAREGAGCSGGQTYFCVDYAYNQYLDDALGANFEYNLRRDYIYVDTFMKWQDANAYCQSEYGTTLATIHNDGDLYAARARVHEGESGWAYIGLNTLGVHPDGDGSWQWASGESSLGSSDPNWFPGEPSGDGGSNNGCAYLHTGPRHGTCHGNTGCPESNDPKYNDVTCDTEAPFLCDNDGTYWYDDYYDDAPPRPQSWDYGYLGMVLEALLFAWIASLACMACFAIRRRCEKNKGYAKVIVDSESE